jgi:hypothetical protein
MKIKVSCPHCRRVLLLTPANAQRFRTCSRTCREAVKNPAQFVVCQACGSSKRVNPAELRRGRRFCSIACRHIGFRGSGNPKWRGGVLVSRGRRYIYSPGHPKATKLGYVAEYRLVAERTLGRQLDRSEVVHHINGDHADNRPENLQVINQSEHIALHRHEMHAARLRALEAKRCHG